MKDSKNIMALIGVLLIVLPTVIVLTADAGNEDEYVAADITRAFKEESIYGGEWVDDLSDESGIEKRIGVIKEPEGFKIRPSDREYVFFQEDFENYTAGQNLFGQNGWIADTTRALSSDQAQFTATTSGPTSQPSTTVGKIYNPDDDYSMVLSNSMDISSGTLVCWAATNKMWTGTSGAMSLSLALMKSSSSTPSSSDRVASIILKNGEAAYRTTPTSTSTIFISSGMSASTWYKFKIDFDCTTSRADFYVYDTSSTLLGSALNTAFMSSATSIKRLELVTPRDHSGVYTTTYWDDFKILPPAGFVTDFISTKEDDFEGYLNGQDVLDTGNWIADTNRYLSSDQAQFTAVSNGPLPMPSSRIGEIYNPDDDYSYIMSEEISFSAGTVQFWVATDMIWLGSSGAMSCMLSLMKSNSAAPDNDDRVATFMLRDGESAYKTTPTTSSVTIGSGIVANSWYRVRIDFNCTLGRASFYVYNSTGHLIGSAVNTNFMSSTDSIKRLELGTSRDHNRVYTTSYWDNITVMGSTVRSEEIDLPTGMSWSTLYIDKEQSLGNRIEFEILDSMNHPIPQFTFNKRASEIDISGLNELDIDTIKINAILFGDTSNSPTLKGWGVEWNDTMAWRDSFTTSLKEGFRTDTVNSKGKIVLEDGENSGRYISETIYLPDGHYWGMLEANMTNGVSLSVLDATTGIVIANMGDITGNGIVTKDVEGIDPVAHRSVKIQADLSNIGGDPELASFSISWVRNNVPSIQSLHIQSLVYRTLEAPITVLVSDDEEDAGSLAIELEYVLEGEETWEQSLLSTPSYNDTSGRWEFIFHPTADAEIGNYSFRINVTDRVGANVSISYQNMIVVKNNIPTAPTISLYPIHPTTDSDIVVNLVEPATDVENTELRYTYTLYINYEKVEGLSFESIDEAATVILPSNYTEKYDIVVCEVYVSDGLDVSQQNSVWVTVVNTLPNFTSPLDPISFDEDTIYQHDISLWDMLEDGDEDTIDISTPGTENISVEIDEASGLVTYIPELNYFGQENITFTASDGDSVIIFNITVHVLSVNDLPIGEITEPIIWADAFLEEDISFEAVAEDVETDFDNLTFTWKDGDDVIGNGPSMVKNWTDVGEKDVSCYVSDGEAEVYLGNVTITISKRPPLYTDEQVYRYHNNSGRPVLFDVVDDTGRSENHTEDDLGSIDLVMLKAEALEYDIIITLELSSSPVHGDQGDPFNSNDGIWGQYDIYLVTSSWAEVEFNQTNLNILEMEGYDPLAFSQDNMGGTWVHLSYGYGSNIGNPVIVGNQMTWTIPMADLAVSGFDIDEYDLYARSIYVEVKDGEMTAGFDTIGKGARIHTVIVPEPEPEPVSEVEEESSYLWLFILIAVVICIAIIGMIVLFIIIRKGKSREENEIEATPVYDMDTAYPQDAMAPGIPQQDVMAPGIPQQDLMAPGILQQDLMAPVIPQQDPIGIPQQGVMGAGIPTQNIDNATIPVGADQIRTDVPPTGYEPPVEAQIPPVEEAGIPAQIEQPTPPQPPTGAVDETVYQGELEVPPSDPAVSTVQQAPPEG